MVNSIKTKKILTAEEKVAALKAKLAVEEKKLQKIRRQEKDNFIKKVGQKIVDEFNITDDERDMFKEDGCIRLNIVGQCRKNEWMGNVSAQMEIKDYDIITQSKYYF